MKYVVSAIRHEKRYHARITHPAQEDGPPYELEWLYHNISHKNRDKCLLKGVEFALSKEECTEVQVIRS